MLTCIHLSHTFQAKTTVLKVWLRGQWIPQSLLVFNFDIQTMITAQSSWLVWVVLLGFFFYMSRKPHTVIPKYLLKTLAIEINNSLNSNHFSFSANHMVLIPLSMLKQPLIRTKPLVWDRDATGISIANCDSLADYYYKQFQLLSLHLQKPHINTEISFWRGIFVFFKIHVIRTCHPWDVFAI